MRRLLASEWAQWVSLVRWLLRRPRAGRDEQAFPHVGGVSVILWAFILMSTVETVVLHLILPWDRIRLVCDVLSVFGVLWMLGLRADLVMHPHLVSPQGLVLRQQAAVNLLLPWAAVGSVSATKELPARGRGVVVVGDALQLAVNNLTNVEVTLSRPLTWEDAAVTTVRFWADDPQALAAAAGSRQLPEVEQRSVH